ncbi:MAG: RND family transporter [Deltaproteobacteria bacterium]|nr:RND family transporter [Deltaproteobacteria bacterium]
MYDFIKKTAVERPKITIAFFIIIAVLSVTTLGGLTRDPTPYLLPPEHESRVNLAKLRANYTGANDGIIILLEAKDTVFKGKTLKRVQQLTDAFENLNIIEPDDMLKIKELGAKTGGETGKLLSLFSNEAINEESWEIFEEILETAESEFPSNTNLIKSLDQIFIKLTPIKEVTSLSNTDNILGKDGGLDVNPVYEDIPETREGLDKIRKNVHGNNLFKNVLITSDDKFTTIVIELGLTDDDVDARFLIYEKIKRTLVEIPGSEKSYIAGMPVTSAAMGITMEEDTNKLFPIVIMIVIASLLITFRSIKGIVVPLSVVILSLIVTLALKAVFNIPLNIITTTLPVFILSIGVADGIHMFSEYRDQIMKGLNKVEAVKKTLKHLTVPVVMTSFTTAAAFYSISFTEIVQLKHFGIFVAVGTIVAMFFSLLFIPALLLILPERMVKKERRESKIENAYSNVLISITRSITKKPLQSAIISVVILAVAIIGSSKVIVDNNNVKYFMDDSDIYISADKLNAKASGSSVINYLVEINGSETEPFKSYKNLKTIENFVAFIQSQKYVGKVLGLSELVKRINLVLNDENKIHNIIPKPSVEDPTGRKTISQLLLLYENGGGDVLTDYTNSNYKKLNIPVVLQTNSSKEMFALNAIVKQYAEQNLPEHMLLSVSGSANVAVAATEEIVSGQVTSLIISVIVVLLMLLITFQSLYFSFIALVPLIMTIAVNYGIMGFFNIPLDIGTAVISSIVIGIGVDYGIHYISRYRNNRKEGMGFQKAIEDTAKHSGKAIVSNTITVAFGFCALMFSVLSPLIIMGWMICLTMIISSVCTMVLIPAILSMGETSTRLISSITGRRKLVYQKI